MEFKQCSSMRSLPPNTETYSIRKINDKHFCNLAYFRTSKIIPIHFENDLDLNIFRCQYQGSNEVCYCSRSYMDDYDEETRTWLYNNSSKIKEKKN